MDRTTFSPARDYETEIEELRRQNEELKNDLVESATVGQNILSRNNELEDQLQEQTECYTKKQETLEQDNYVLRSKLETQTKLVEEQFLELERWKNDVQEARKSKLEQDKLEAQHSKVVERLESEVVALQAEVNNSQLVEAALREKVERQEQLLSQWKERDNSNSTFSGLESEVGALQSAVTALEKDKDTVTLKLQDVEAQLKVLTSSDTASKAKAASLQEELHECIEETNSLRTALQYANEKSVESAQELQMLKLEMMGEAAGQRGNSLFSEVEDRRMETEKRFISLKVKHESLEKAHSVAQQQLRKLKSNLQVYLSQRGQAAVDSGRVERLERAVASYRSQVERLSQENMALKKDTKVAGPVVVKAPEEGGSGKTVPRELADFLQYELERVRKECVELASQLDQRKMEKLFDADKLRECEGRLNVVEAEAVKYHNEAAKCRQKLQEAVKKWRAELNLREKLTQEVAGLKVDLECAKQKTKGRKSLAPKPKEEKSSTCTDSEAGKPADGGDVPFTTGKANDQPTQTRSGTSSKEEEVHAVESHKTEEDKENMTNVSTTAKMMEPCLQDGTKSKLPHSRPIVSEEVVNKCPQQ